MEWSANIMAALFAHADDLFFSGQVLRSGITVPVFAGITREFLL